MHRQLVEICGYTFAGPFGATAGLMNAPGVYVILDNRADSASYGVLDVGESGDVRDRIENHDRKACWMTNASGVAVVAVRYMPYSTADERRDIEHRIRMTYSPRCGEI